MKVALLSPSYHPAIGGLETHLKQIAEKLVREVDLEVYTLKNGSQLQDETKINGVTVKRFKSRRLSYGIELPATEFIDALRNSDIDIIHLHSFHTLLPYFTLKCMNNANRKLIITPHYHGRAHALLRNMLFQFYKPMLGKISRNADKIVCVSRYEKSLIIKDFAVADSNVTVIPNGIDIAPSEIPSCMHGDPSRVLYVGRLEKYKNLGKLVQAMKILDGKGFTLTIVGDGSAKNELLKLIARLDLQKSVCIRSNLSSQELMNVYASSGIFVMPSSYEAYGIAVAEALSFGLKVIVADTSALSEFVQDGYAYGVSLPITAGKIANAIVNASQNSTPTRKYVPHTWDSVVAKLMNVYKSVN